MRRSSTADSDSSPSPSSRIHSGALSDLQTAPARSAHGLVAAEPVQLLSDSYALLAARRTLKRRLFSFVRLLDYMVADAVHSMVARTLSYLVMRLHGAQHHQQLARERASRRSPPKKLLQLPQHQQPSTGKHASVHCRELPGVLLTILGQLHCPHR